MLSIRSNTTLLLTIGMIFLGTSSISSAHSSGNSVEVTVGDYLLDIGYTPDFVVNNNHTRFDFSILQVSDEQPVTFDDIWVRIEKDNRIFFAGGLSKQRFGATGFSYNFSESGEYQIYVRFSNDGEPLAETDFDFTVNQSAEKTSSIERTDVLKAFIALVAGFIIGVLSYKYAVRNKQTPHE